MTEPNERMGLGTRALIAAAVVASVIILGPLLVIIAIEGWHAIVRTWNSS